MLCSITCLNDFIALGYHAFFVRGKREAFAPHFQLEKNVRLCLGCSKQRALGKDKIVSISLKGKCNTRKPRRKREAWGLEMGMNSWFSRSRWFGQASKRCSAVHCPTPSSRRPVRSSIPASTSSWTWPLSQHLPEREAHQNAEHLLGHLSKWHDLPNQWFVLLSTGNVHPCSSHPKQGCKEAKLETKMERNCLALSTEFSSDGIQIS